MKRNEIYLGDCLELMPKHVEDKSIDMIFCDLPYGTTQCKWDSIIDLDKLWNEYRRVIKDNGVIVLFASQPFTSILTSSNLKMFKYSYTWDKITKTNHLNAKKQPLRQVEDICVFYKKQPTYKPQGLIECEVSNFRPNHFKYKKGEKVYGEQKEHGNKSTYTNYPSNLIQYSNGNHNSLHPTQKPLDLIEYMIKTYTNEGDLILDNTCGSGTTGLGAKNLGRNFIMMEQDPKYYDVACKRVLT
ncbi:DNA methylase [Cellulophaga phage phi13:2]|uniref:DNA methylase n=1 Tax=Cellulophaga phage phi13:2 TaxID=1328030 RepID=S0A2M2_9CAUD|nr:DNA methylase [Cellulophaga phage phi13:2]AGO49646.1 DNA methylase [Cellulophaga phage phi13:2]